MENNDFNSSIQPKSSAGITHKPAKYSVEIEFAKSPDDVQEQR